MTPAAAPLLFVRVLAATSGKPAGLLADGAGDAVALLGLVESELGRALPAALPCFVPSGLEPSLQQAYAKAGWKQVEPGAVFYAAGKLDPGHRIRIGAQQRLEKFYQDFGFETVSAPYDEDGILHIDMLR